MGFQLGWIQSIQSESRPASLPKHPACLSLCNSHQTGKALTLSAWGLAAQGNAHSGRGSKEIASSQPEVGEGCLSRAVAVCLSWGRQCTAHTHQYPPCRKSCVTQWTSSCSLLFMAMRLPLEQQHYTVCSPGSCYPLHSCCITEQVGLRKNDTLPNWTWTISLLS